jgi:hypothetical protein
MGKFNLTDAAKAILHEDAKSTFDASVARGHKDAPSKLPTSVAYGTKDVGEVAGEVKKQDDDDADYTKGVPSATPPGATPPVGSEPAAKLSGPADSQGTEHKAVQADATDYNAIRDRIKAKLATQTMKANPGATFQSYAEETEEEKEEEVVAEEKEKEEGHEDAAEDKKMIKAVMKKQKMKEDMDADVDALLSGENLSEEFKQKATTIFEAAVITRSQAILEEIEEALYEEFEASVEEIKEDLANKLDGYIGYMVEEWMKENQLAIEKGLRAEIVEDFITGLKGLFEEHYIEIPEEKVDVVEELTTKVEELTDQINEQIESAVEMRKELNEHKKNEAIHAVCEGLTQTQVEKLKSLAESVEFTTEEDFAQKLETLVDAYLQKPVKVAESSALTEEVEIEEEKKQTVSVDPLIQAAAQSISKTLVK